MTFELLAAAGEAAPQNSFGFVEAMEQGGIIAWSILAVLVIMSRGQSQRRRSKQPERRQHRTPSPPSGRRGRRRSRAHELRLPTGRERDVQVLLGIEQRGKSPLLFVLRRTSVRTR